MMDLRLLTLSFDPERGGFPEQPLAGIGEEIVSVAEHFFFHGQHPHLLLIVQVKRAGEVLQRPYVGRPSRDDVRESLQPEEAHLYESLRLWRNRLATERGEPPFVILTNRHLAEISKQRPRDASALRQIHGIGKVKSGRFGAQILQIVEQHFYNEVP